MISLLEYGTSFLPFFYLCSSIFPSSHHPIPLSLTLVTAAAPGDRNDCMQADSIAASLYPWYSKGGVKIILHVERMDDDKRGKAREI